MAVGVDVAATVRCRANTQILFSGKECSALCGFVFGNGNLV
ncbi:hypothetical protein BIFBRE_03316 [Bifidobacterium breve DSM 20213 = JCM 1192]|uniref:Uncharacterized protein n=1 Tax=Bifidobacterium breve DSM 20213 = JCM 1192 TaxID=518634 RepID=D4BML9_BIFBR|nr:hypothetical protein BIFBRE_03316 [Bifidobacterium breve DSM 20213 = JCM 1192]